MRHLVVLLVNPLMAKNVKLNNIAKNETPSSIHAILAEADKYRGVPYVFGGTTPSGFDCSGYVKYVFENKVFPYLVWRTNNIT